MIPYQSSLHAKLTPPHSSSEKKHGHTTEEKTLTATEKAPTHTLKEPSNNPKKRKSHHLDKETPPISQELSFINDELLELLSGSFPGSDKPGLSHPLILKEKRIRKKRKIDEEFKENSSAPVPRRKFKIHKRVQKCSKKIAKYRSTFTPASPHARKVLKPLNEVIAEGTDNKIMKSRNRNYVVAVNKGAVEQKSVEAYFNKYKSPHVMSASSIVIDGVTRFTTMPKAEMDLHAMLNKIKKSTAPLIKQENTNLRLLVYRYMLRGLDTMHSHETVHEDIKPPNGLWFRREDGSHAIKVCDFSRSKFKGNPVRILSSSAEHTHPDILESITNYQSVPADPKHDLFTIASLLFRNLTNSHHSHYSSILKRGPKVPFSHKNNNKKYIRYYREIKDEIALQSIKGQIEKQKENPYIKLVEPDRTEHIIPSTLTPILKWCLMILNRQYKYDAGDAMILDQAIETVFIESKSLLQTELGTKRLLDELLLD